MDLTILDDIGPWEWPRTAQQELKDALRDRTRSVDERSVAANHAGETVVMDDEMAGLLLDVITSSDEADRLRARAAISLGPTLQQCDEDGYDGTDPYPDPLVSEETYNRIRETLESVFKNTANPSMVRRRVLEAAVRAPADWHADAIRQAYAMKDGDWKQTAVFCMGYVRGFDQEIMQALQSRYDEMRFEAIRAAGRAEVEEAWPLILDIIEDSKTDKRNLLAAIEASASLCPIEDSDVISELTDSDDEDIAAAADEALMMINIEVDDYDGDSEEADEDEDEDEDLEYDDLEDDDLDDDEGSEDEEAEDPGKHRPH